ncbi:hypothetical protein CXF83_21850 [Shewanella sp. Choline-02u-19]|uniref:DNA-3-methyladenine glycosylase family protein n=1 Tax=unclassified Shewanella TaxID=196818 RepID=UPI000C3395A7|nr:MULTISPECIES: hypothetical protein [unclassified Shewanella]PKH59327.1 hypothetical protein CXF84_03510 [Shewanella sp. Bg11-22]PKI29162.1 hypothetical protein CXF83_21850 [Shewanella sp. Choline-02u-19]
MEDITSYLKQQYPDLKEYIEQATPIVELTAKDTHLVEALSKIIVGQMLSRHVANTIFSKVEHLFEDPKLLLQCSEPDLTQHGISRNKSKAILNFAQMYFENPNRFDNWEKLEFDHLRKESKDIWGVSDWSISILALFHFGHSDIFPDKDGTIKRALVKLEEIGVQVNLDHSRPFRSYLAIYLWKFVDENII